MNESSQQEPRNLDVFRRLDDLEAIVHGLAAASHPAPDHAEEIASTQKRIEELTARLGESIARLDTRDARMRGHLEAYARKLIGENRDSILSALGAATGEALSESRAELTKRIDASLAETAGEAVKLRATVAQQAETAAELLRGAAYHFAEGEQ